MTREYRNRFLYGHTFIDNDGLCVYCGSRASQLDHFVPLSVIYSLSDFSNVRPEKVTLECCAECNQIAGSHVFKTVADKRAFIHRILKDKYYELLECEWSPEELDEMGYALRHYIEASLKLREWIDQRLKWQNKNNPAAVRIAKVRSRLGVHGKGSATQNALRNGTTNAARKY